MMQAGTSIFVEIGPQPILRGYLRECLQSAAADGRVIATMSRTADNALHLRKRVFDTLIAGGEADLGAMFPERGRFVDLPAYAWQRERHWLAASGESGGVTSRRPVHPLLGYRLDPNEHLWECHLDTDRAPAYADHKIGGETVLPAAAYVEMALAAAHEIDPGTLREIEDLEIRAPVALSEHHSRTLRFVLDPGDGRFTVKGRARASDESWRVHATGRLAAHAAHPAQRAAQQGVPAFVLSRAGPPITAQAHYRLARAAGLEYGPAFRAVAEAWVEEGTPASTVDARLETPDCLRDSADQAFLHPAYLDAAFQLLLHLFDGESAGGVAFVPVRIGRATLLRPRAAACFARAQVIRRGPRSLVAHCTLYGADREAVAVLREVRLRAVPLRRAALADLLALRTRAIPAPLPTTARYAALPAADRLIAACAARLHASARQQARWRYFNDVEPLLEALLAAHAAVALKQLRADPGATDPAQRSRLERLAGDEPLADPAALWSQMFRDHPDHANEILWIGRLGMHLADIARDRTPAERFLPQIGDNEGDAWSAPWMPATADYAQAIADLVELSLALLPEGRRLRVLAVNAEHAPAVSNVLSRLDPDRCDLAVATDTAPRGSLYDLVLVEDGLASAGNREQALGELRRQTAENGLLVLLERHPSRAVLLAMDFLAPGGAASPRVHPLAPAIWRAELARQGFQQAMVVEDVPGIEASSYLLVARAVPYGADAGTAAADALAVKRRWLLVADKAGLSSRVAAGLGAELQSRGETVELARSEPVSAADWQQLLAPPGAQRAGYHAVVHLCGLGESRHAPGRMLKRLADRCESLGGLLSACAAGEAKPECWAVSARAAVSLLPEAARGSRGLRPSADDAAYHGFARSAMNEHPELTLRLVDLAAPANAPPVAELAEALLQATPKTRSSSTPGGRYAVRVDASPVHAPRAAGPAPQPSLLRLEPGRHPGQLKNLRWTRRPALAPGEGEVEIEVRAAGLNFRDVMYALGQLADAGARGRLRRGDARHGARGRGARASAAACADSRPATR